MRHRSLCRLVSLPGVWELYAGQEAHLQEPAEVVREFLLLIVLKGKKQESTAVKATRLVHKNPLHPQGIIIKQIRTTLNYYLQHSCFFLCSH